MNKTIYTIIITIILLSCNSAKKVENTITVSILPQKFLVEKIAGNKYNVNVLIPEGANPATCELTTKQITNLYKSNIFFSIGSLPYETIHIHKLIEQQNTIKHICLSDSLNLIRDIHEHAGHFHKGNIDPHVWTSPKNVKIMCKSILENLIETYPQDKNIFKTNYKKLISDINNLDKKIKLNLKDKTKRNFIIYHPALSYFAKDYNLNQIPLQYEGKSPSPVHIKNIIETAKKTNTKLVFIQSQFDNNKADFIAKEINGTVIAINPLNENWLEEMNRLANILNKYLK